LHAHDEIGTRSIGYDLPDPRGIQIRFDFPLLILHAHTNVIMHVEAGLTGGLLYAHKKIGASSCTHACTRFSFLACTHESGTPHARDRLRL
jgi:hypothetical protein